MRQVSTEAGPHGWISSENTEKEILESARSMLLHTPDSISLERATLITEAYKLHADEPPVLRRANAFYYLLDHMTLDLQSNPIFAGNTSEHPRAWTLYPEYGFHIQMQARIEFDWLRNFHLEEQVPEDIRSYWEKHAMGGEAGVGHLAVNLDTVVHKGLAAVIAKAQDLIHAGDETARQNRRAFILSCEAVIQWARRYRAEAYRLARKSENSVHRTVLLRLVEALDRVPAQPARNLFEGLQAIALVHLAIALEGHGFSISIGLPDRVLAPFAHETVDMPHLIAAFMLKIASNSYLGSVSKTQAITIGGVDRYGNDQCNALTLAFLDACDAMRLPDPHLFLRWSRTIATQVKEKTADMLSRGVTQPLLIGDEETANGLITAGIHPDDAWDYCVIGCNEIGIPGKMYRSATGPSLNYAEHLTALLQESNLNVLADMDTLLTLYEQRLTTCLTQAFSSDDAWWKMMTEQVPTPFTSALMDGAIQRGQDMHTAGMYPHGGLFERGFTNAIDGLITLETLVFQKQQFSLDDLVQSMKNNFVDTHISSAIKSCPKWGNDIPQADAWAVRLLEIRERVLNQIITASNLRPRLCCHVVRSLNWVDGLTQGASPDGRKHGEPYASSIGPETCHAQNGPTAVLNSVCSLQARKFYQGGYNLNLTLPLGVNRRPDPIHLLSLVETFFANGGQELQINVLNPDTLKDAQTHPEQYPHLLVRVAGFTARFASLSRLQQDEMIQRAENAAVCTPDQNRLTGICF